VISTAGPAELHFQIMPSESRAFFDSMKTTSFHITLVASCKLTGRAGGFKINVWREGGQKRYEFEAENRKQAGALQARWAHQYRTDGLGSADIISSIRQLRVTQARQRFQADPVYRMKAYQTARGSSRPPVRMIPRR